MEQQNGKAKIEDSPYIFLRIHITDIFDGLTVDRLRALVSGSGEEETGGNECHSKCTECEH